MNLKKSLIVSYCPNCEIENPPVQQNSRTGDTSCEYCGVVLTGCLFKR
jgi:transcription initiation factor TFIIIB Brf1 subunit/transcription initiation factor TFIIB